MSTSNDFSAVRELEAKYEIRDIRRQGLCMVRGENNRLCDLSGRSYLDLTAGDGENCFGCSPAWLIEAVSLQAQTLFNAPERYYIQSYGRVLEKLVAGTGFNKATLVGSAYEANSMALSLARGYFKENKSRRARVIVAAGSTGGSDNAISGASGVGGTIGGIGSGAADGAAGSGIQKEGNVILQRVRLNDFAALKQLLNPETAMLIVEPLSEAGIRADYDYLVNAYALCKSMDILLMCDETRIGLGRTGTRFAYEPYGIQPDIVTLSKGVAAGLPVGAVLARSFLQGAFKPSVRQPSAGNPIVSAATEAALDHVDEGTLKDIEDKGAYLMSRLVKLNKYNFVLDVRGKGLFAAIELSARIMSAKVANQMEKLGYLIGSTEGNVIKFTPPFTITKAEIDEALDVLSQLFSSTNI